MISFEEGTYTSTMGMITVYCHRSIDEPCSAYLDDWQLSVREWYPPEEPPSQYRGRRWFEHCRKRNGWTRKVETRVYT